MVFHDLVKQLPTFVKSAMYADDLVIWSTEDYATTAQIGLQAAINVLSNWAKTTYVQCRNEGKMQFSPSEKTSWYTMGCGRSGIKN